MPKPKKPKDAKDVPPPASTAATPPPPANDPPASSEGSQPPPSNESAPPPPSTEATPPPPANDPPASSEGSQPPPSNESAPPPPPPEPIRRRDVDTLALKPSKYLEKRIGLSVRVFKPGVPFEMATPQGVVGGTADDLVVLRQDGVRQVVSAAELEAGFTFIR